MSTSSKQFSLSAPRAWRLYRARPSKLIMALLSVWGASTGVMGFAQNVIVPNGTTATQLVVNGAVTDITTGTIRGGTAINAFSRFDVDRNNTVNLVVPSNAQVLLNMVTDAPVTINGVVNSLKDGRIGGNVVFADPFGMIVGSSGALNVGSLLVTTPTRKFIDGVIGSDGSIDSLSVSALLAGSAPSSGLGTIRIDGQVNARDVIRLQGADVQVNGALRAGADVAHQAAFLGAVNADASAGGAALVERGGVIEIVASGDVAIAGRVSVDGHNAAAGRIDVRAAHDVTVAPGAQVSARGHGGDADGGRVVLYGEHDAKLGAGALLDASAGGSGDGGFVELSATRTVSIDGGSMRAGAPGGKAGTVLIDPEKIEWTGQAHDDIGGDGSTIVLEATDAITLNDVVLSSRKVAAGATRANIETLASTGASGDITLKAPRITLSGGTRLLAHDDRATAGAGVGAGVGGKVRLEASSNVAQPKLGVANATSSIAIGHATIKANDVELYAKNTIDSRYVYQGDTPVNLAAGLALSTTQDVLGMGAELLGVALVFSDVVAKASITVGGSAVIQATRAAALTAENDTKSGIARKFGPNGVPGASSFGIGASYVSNASEASVVIESGARISATDLTIRAHNNAGVVAQTKSPQVYDAGQDAVSIALSVTNADIEAEARIDQGAILTVGGALKLEATNLASFENESETETGNEGRAAASIAVATHKSSTNAVLNASVGDAASVAVLSVNDVQKDVVTASSSVGASAAGAVSNQLAAQSIQRLEKPFYNKLGLGSIKPKEDLAPSGSNGFRIGGAIAIANNRHTANASIGGASTIHASESALLAARVVATDVKVGAVSAAISQSSDQSAVGTAKTGYSAGLAVANITHDATALVDDNVSITAPRIAVAADTWVPIRNNLLFGSSGSTASFTAPFTRWTAIDTISDALGSIGDIGDVFNSVSSAKASGDGSEDSTGIYGSVSILTMNDHARAEVGSGAKLRVLGNVPLSAAAPWRTTLQVEAARPNDSLLGLSGARAAITQDFKFDNQVTVAADVDATYLFLAGQSPASSSAKGLGASIGQSTLNNNTRAIVREGAVIESLMQSHDNGAAGSRTWTTVLVQAADSVAVKASSEQRVISLATAGGVGATFGLNGTLAMNEVNSNVHALIDDEATVRARSLTVQSDASPVLWSIAGSLNHASSASVGVGIAINKVVAESRAEIADNDTLATGGATRSSLLAGAGATIQTPILLVDARTGGAVNAVSVAGSLAWNSADKSPGFISKLKGYYSGAVETASAAVDTITFTKKPAASPKPDAGQDTKKEPTFTFAGAGSASANQTEMRTAALIAGVTVDQVGNGAAGAPARSLTVRAVGDADIDAGSGAAAISAGRATTSKRNTAIAGAVAVNQLGNGTSARIERSTINKAGDVTVQALTGGEQLAVAIAAAVNVSGAETTRSDQMVGSISVTQTLSDDDGTKNFARAGISDATITADPAGAGAGLRPALGVTAYNRAFVGTGGGALALKISANAEEEGVAAGVAFSLAKINNDVVASIERATVKQFDTLAVRAYNATEIAAGAAFFGASTAPKANSFAGSTVVSIIDNSTSANIGGGSTIETVGDVTVSAADRGADSALEDLIDPSGKRKSSAPALDYCAGTATGITPTGSCITSVAGVLQASSGSNYGLSLGVNQISNSTSAAIGAGSVKATGAGSTIRVQASADTSMVSIAAGVGLSKKMAGAGSASLNFVDNKVSAQLGDVGNAGGAGATLEAAHIDVTAGDTSSIRSLAGQISVGKDNAIGAALTVNDSHSTIAANVVNAKLTAADSVLVDAANSSKIDSIAVSGAVSPDGNALGGSLALNFIGNSADAALVSSTVESKSAAGNKVAVKAADVSAIRSLSGAAAFAAKVGVGVALAYNSIDNASRALIDSSSLSGVNTLALQGTLESRIGSLAIALGGGSGEVGLAGSVTMNEIGLSGNLAKAELSNSSVTAASVDVDASDKSTIESLAGAVAGSKGAGFGAAAADNAITTTVKARIDKTGVHQANTVSVDGASTADIRSASAAGAIGGDGAASGSVSSNRIGNKTYAELVDAEVDGGKTAVSLSALDKATIRSLSGAAAGGGTAAAGLAVSLNMIGFPNHTQVAQARVSGIKAGSAGLTVDNLLVQADSASIIETLAVGAAGAGTASAGGSVATNIMAKDVAALIDAGAKVQANDNIGVLADSRDKTSVVAGALAVGGAGAFGATVAFNQIDGTVRAYVDGATVDAGARDAGNTLMVNSGDLASPINVGAIQEMKTYAPDLAETRLAVRGLAVNASSHQSVATNAASGGASAGVSGAVVPVINLLGGETAAYVHNAQVNTREGPAAGADVNVLASSHAFAADFALGVAVGQAAASGAAVGNRSERATRASVTDSTIGRAATRTVTAPVETTVALDWANHDPYSDALPGEIRTTTTRHTLTSAPSVGALKVQARSSQTTADIVTGVAGGLAGGSASGVVTVFGGATDAYLERGSVTASSLTVDARSRNAYNMLAVSGAGALVAAGASFGVGVANGRTDAHVGEQAAGSRNTSLKLGGPLSVAALSESDFNGLVAAGSAGGFAGAAGSAMVTLMQNTTVAGVYNVASAAKAGPAGAPRSVTDPMGNVVVTLDASAGGLLQEGLGAVSVKADETIIVKPKGGALAVGGLGAALGATANVVAIKSAVTAQVINSAIDSAADVLVAANSDKRVDMVSLSGGAGATTGIGATVAMLVVGSGATGSGSAELDNNDGGNQGTLSRVNAFSSAPTATGTAQPGQRSAAGFDVKAAVGSLNPDAVTARVVGGSVNGKSLTVSALAATSTDNLAGAGALSGLLGAGGAGAVSRVYSTVGASIQQANVHAERVDVKALAKDGGAGRAASTTSIAGGAGLVGLGAAVSDALIQNQVTAHADGVFTGTAGGAMTVDALDETRVVTDGVGAAAGALAVGVVVSHADKRSSVTATVGANTNVAGYKLLAVKAATSAALGATVEARSTGAAGGLLAAGAGAESVADNRTHVSAIIGDHVSLPDGDVSITANNDSRQYAAATGIAGAGLVAASGAVARANSGSAGERSTTIASLGDGVKTSATRAGYLKVDASGVDANTATATAAAGGVVAGNASQASTADYASVTARIGSSALRAGAMSISADHIDSHDKHADSLNASVVGGSGANASHTADVIVNTLLANDANIKASGNVQVLADNMFSKNVGGHAESASGAGGGVINGAAAGSDTTILAQTNVLLGDRVGIDSGPGATASRYGLVLRASNHMSLNDTVVLRTGGVVAGAHVVSRTDATLNSLVATGLGNRFDTLGSLGIGSYANAAASSSALVETHGLAAVGEADATTNITSNQLVRIGGGNSRIRSFGNLDITAGKDPTGDFDTVLSGNASAQGYVRGLIAVPTAEASTTLASNADLDIQTGAVVESAQNAIVGAYQGASNALANGTGRGFELGFIPVTAGSSKVNTPSSANVTINGAVNAGIFHDLRLKFEKCGDGTYCSSPIKSTDSAPVSITYRPQFNAVDYINKNFANPVTRDTMLEGVSSQTVGAIELGPLYAAGGTVTVNAASLHGAGALTSYGAPTIEVINTGPDYLLVGAATIPNTPGGQVLFSGTANRAAALANNMRLSETGAGQAATISIHNTYAGNVGGKNFGPALMLMGEVNNLGGAIDIVNAKGSIGQTGQILGQQVTISAPNGVFAVELTGDKAYYAASNPYSEWQKAMIWPGGNPALALPKADLAIAYVASSVEKAANFADNVAFNRSFIHEAGWGEPNNRSRIYYGAAYRYSDHKQTADGLSPMGNSLPLFNQGYSHIPMVPMQTLKKELADYTSADLSGAKASANSSAILGTRVAIKAKYIDVNGKITAGQATDWSVDLHNYDVFLPEDGLWPMPMSLSSKLAEVTDWYRSGMRGALYEINSNQLGRNSLADSPVRAVFDAATQEISLYNVSASSGGGSVRLEGQILSTNAYGNIHVNGGFGKVNIVNQTGYALKVGDINAGNGDVLAQSIGKVEIIDTSFDSSLNHTLYTYSPTTGVRKYVGAQATAADDLTLVADPQGGATGSIYNPKANMRWEWTESASLSRSITMPTEGYTVTAGNWQFNGDVNSPWTRGNAGVVMTGSATAPVFKQEISGAITDRDYRYFGYGGCDDIAPGSQCNYGFLQSSDATSPRRGWWLYEYVKGANLTIKSSVKADNAITIDFAGNEKGMVAITSKGALQLTGDIINPSGLTSINAAGGITQGAKSTLSTGSLSLSTGGAIGTEQSAIRATLGTGGVLNASSGAGVYLDLASGATVAQVAAGSRNGVLGDVRITADGALLAAGTASANIKGNNITLESRQGAIGGAAAPMVIKAVGNPGINGTLGGVVNAQAQQGIALRQIGGDLLVGRIASTGAGDVDLSVSNGTIYDARGQTSANTLSEAQVQQVWASLKLTEALGAETGKRSDASVVAFENQIQREYRKYWDLRARGSVDGAGHLLIDAANLDLLRPLAAAANNGAASDAQVAAYANDQYQRTRIALGEAAGANPGYGAGWESLADFTRYNAGFKFVASAEQITGLTKNAVWDENQLSYSISRSALEPTPAQQVGNAAANIVGGAITINTSAAVGKLAPAVAVSLAQLSTGALSNTQKAALGMAKAPGDIKLTGVTGAHQEVVYDFGKTPEGVTMTGFRLAQNSPLFIDATGPVKINALGGAVYLQGTGSNPDLRIDRVAATHDVVLTAPRSILAEAGASGVLAPIQVRAGGDVRLTAGSGNLGSAEQPLVYHADGALQLATAGQSMYLRAPMGDMRVGGVAAGDQVRLEALTGSILAANLNAGVTIRGRDIGLTAAHHLGSAANPLRVATGERDAGGKLVGVAGGSAYLYSPGAADLLTVAALEARDIDLVAAGDLALGQLKARNVKVSSTGATQIDGAIDSQDEVALEASALHMAAASSIKAGGAVKLNATHGDAILAHVAGAGLAITAFGRIGAVDGAVHGGVNLLARQRSGAAGQVMLAADGIGAFGAALGIDTDLLSAVSGGGAIVLDLWSNTRAALIDGAAAVDVSARGSLDAQRIVGASVTLSALGGLDLASVSATDGAASIQGDQDVRIDELSSSADAAVTGRDVTADRVFANGTVAINARRHARIGTLSAAGDVLLDAGSATLISLSAAGQATLRTSAGNLNLTMLDAGLLAASVGGNAYLGRTSVSGAAALDVNGVLVADRFVTGGPALLRAGGAVSINDVETGLFGAPASFSLTSGGAQSLGQVQASGDITLRGAALDLNRAGAGGRVELHADTHAQVGVIDAAGDVALDAASAAVDRLAAGGGATLATSNGDLLVGSLEAGSTSSIRAGAGATVGEVTVGGSGQLADLTVTSIGAQALGQVTASGDIALVGARLVLDTATAGRDLRVAMQGQADLTSVTAGGDASLSTSGGNLTVAALSSNTLAATVNGDAVLNKTTLRGASVVAASGALKVGEFASDGTAKFDAGSTASMDRVEVGGGDLAVTSGAGQTLGQVTASGDIALAGASLVLDTVAAGRDLRVAMKGQADLRTVTAGGDASLSTIGGNLTATTLSANTLAATVKGDAVLNNATLRGASVVAASGALTAGEFASKGTAKFDAGSTASLDRVRVASGDLAVTSAGGQTLGQLTASGDVNLSTVDGNLALQSLEANGLSVRVNGDGSLVQARMRAATTVAATGALAVGRLVSAGDAVFEAGRAASFTQVDVGGSGRSADLAVVSGGAQSIGAVSVSGDAGFRTANGNLTLASLDANNLALNANGDAAVTRASLRGAASLVASGALAVDRLVALGDASLVAGGAARLNQLDVGGPGRSADLTVSSGSGQTLGRIAASGDIALRGAALALGDAQAAGAMRIVMDGQAEVTSATAGAQFELDAGEVSVKALESGGASRLAVGGAATLGTVKVGDAAAANGGADLTVNVGGSLAATSVEVSGGAVLDGGAMALGALGVRGDLALRTDAGGASYNRLAAGGDVDATVAREFTGAVGGVLTSGRDVRIDAGSFGFDEANGARAVSIATRADVIGNTLLAGDTMLIRAGGSIDVANLRAGGALDMEAANNTRVGSLRAASVSAATPGTLTMDVLVEGGQLKAGAKAMVMNVTSSGRPLEFDVTGYRGGVADSVVLGIDAPTGTSFPRFMARQATLVTNADINNFGSAYITEAMRFTNPSGQMVMNNVDPTSVPGALLQLVQPGFGFTLAQRGVYYATDAYVTQYAPQYRPIAPNHQESRLLSAILSFGASSANAVGTQQERQRSAPRQEGQTPYQRPVLELRPRIDAVDGESPVNWGDDVTLVPAQQIELAANSRIHPQ